MAWFATRQSGLVARRQLLAAGVSAKEIERRVEKNLLIPQHRGVYRLAHRADTAWAREMAVALACGPGATISHRSAARVQELLPYPARADVWVTVTTGRGAGLSGVRIARTRVLDPEDIGFAGWLPLTSAARTLLDLAGLVDSVQLERAVAEAQVRRLVGEADLRAQLERGNGRRGARALRRLLDRGATPAYTRSKAERLMLELIRDFELPEPRVNARVGDFVVDFYWPQHRVVAEFDGYRFHSDIRAFRRDRERSNQLQLMGMVVLRFTWDDLTRTPATLARRVREALGRPR